MMIWNELGIRARYIAMPVVMASILGYFGYHAVEGNNGLRANARLTQEIITLEKKAALVHDQRERLERRVALLRPDNLDPDLLAEQARKVLGYAHPDEVIVLSPDDVPQSKTK